MAAQAGDLIVLSYGPQGSQQDGHSIVLDSALAGTSRRLSSTVTSPWAPSKTVIDKIRAVVPASQQEVIPISSRWGPSASKKSIQRVPWGPSSQIVIQRQAPWGIYLGRAQVPLDVAWVASQERNLYGTFPWGVFEAYVAQDRDVRWGASKKVDLAGSYPWGGPMVVLQVTERSPYAASRALNEEFVAPWTRYSQQLHPSWSIIIPVGGGLPDPETYTIPVRRAYIMVNSFSMKRLDDNTPIIIKSLSMNIDATTWAWGLSATCPRSELDKINPITGSVDVEVQVNGDTWRFTIEDVTENRSFGDSSISVRGRSLAAELDAPGASKRSYLETETLLSAQLAANELARTDILNEYLLDWFVIDDAGWSVPGGAFSYQDLSPMAAVKRIAESAGAYVQAHRSLRQLIVRSMYPAAPWAWADTVPDMVLPLSVAISKGWAWNKSPDYNSVFVSGETQGVANFIDRDGTAGDLALPDIIDPLITTDPVSRERGRVALSDCGRRAYVSLETPLGTEVPLMLPGMLIQVTDGGSGIEAPWKGMVRGQNISVGWDSTLKVRQSINVERRYLA